MYSVPQPLRRYLVFTIIIAAFALVNAPQMFRTITTGFIIFYGIVQGTVILLSFLLMRTVRWQRISPLVRPFTVAKAVQWMAAIAPGLAAWMIVFAVL